MKEMSPDEFVEWFLSESDARQREIAARIQGQAERADECFRLDHAGRLAPLRAGAEGESPGDALTVAIRDAVGAINRQIDELSRLRGCLEGIEFRS